MPNKDPEKRRATNRRNNAALRARRRALKYGPGVGDQRGKHGMEKRSASKHYRWNLARMRSTEGYALVRVGYEHPLAMANGYAYEHLIVWASAANPIPAKDQVLTFRNGDKSDTRLRNLKLIPRRELLARNNVHIRQNEHGQFVRAEG